MRYEYNINLSGNSDKMKSIQLDIKFDDDMKETEDTINRTIQYFIDNIMPTPSKNKPMLNTVFWR